MSDNKNRGGQKLGNQGNPGTAEQKQSTKKKGGGQRSDADKRQDQTSNPDDADRKNPNESAPR